jgi:hypothetical protein
MTILSVAQQVSSVIGVARPQALFPNAGSDRTARELVDLATEMAQRIAYDTREWSKMIEAARFTGDGVTDHFALPANFKRMLLTANVWRSTSAVQPMMFIADADQWLQRRARGTYSSSGEWIIFGNEIFIVPVLGTGVTAAFMYLDKNCINLASGGRGDVFMNDLDTFVIDERLLRLAMIWQWKANKGSPYAEDMANYQDALANIAGADKPAPIMIDRLPMSAAVNVAYPFPIVLGPGGAPI